MKKKKFLKLFEQNLCNISQTCKAIGISRQLFYHWLKNDKNFKEKVELIKENLIDEVESELFKKIKEGNITAIIFFLKTKAKHRGYSEKMEIKSDLKLSENNSIKIYLPAKE